MFRMQSTSYSLAFLLEYVLIVFGLHHEKLDLLPPPFWVLPQLLTHEGNKMGEMGEMGENDQLSLPTTTMQK